MIQDPLKESFSKPSSFPLQPVVLLPLPLDENSFILQEQHPCMYTVLGGGREHRAARFIVWILLSLATLTKEPRSYQIKTEWCFVKKKKKKNHFLFPSPPTVPGGLVHFTHVWHCCYPSPHLVSSDMMNWRLICFKEKHLALS